MILKKKTASRDCSQFKFIRIVNHLPDVSLRFIRCAIFSFLWLFRREIIFGCFCGLAGSLDITIWPPGVVHTRKKVFTVKHREPCPSAVCLMWTQLSVPTVSSHRLSGGTSQRSATMDRWASSADEMSEIFQIGRPNSTRRQQREWRNRTYSDWSVDFLSANKTDKSRGHSVHSILERNLFFVFPLDHILSGRFDFFSPGQTCRWPCLLHLNVSARRRQEIFSPSKVLTFNGREN